MIRKEKPLLFLIFVELFLAFLWKFAEASAELKFYISTPIKSQICLFEKKCSGSEIEPWPNLIYALDYLSNTELEDRSSGIELIFLEELNEITADDILKSATPKQEEENYIHFLKTQKLIHLIIKPREGLERAILKINPQAFTIVVPLMMDIKNIVFQAEEEVREIKLRWVDPQFAFKMKELAETGASLFLLNETLNPRSVSFQDCEFKNLFQKDPFAFKSLMFISTYRVSFSLNINKYFTHVNLV